MPRPDAPLSIEVPAPGADRPAWAKVGIVAALGFVLGILWPRLTSTRIAPHPPGENAPAVASMVSSAAIQGLAEPPTAMARASAASAATFPAPSNETKISVGPGAIVSCRDASEDINEDCGALELDPVAVPRIKALARCPAATGAVGKLSIGFDVDFRRKSMRILAGKSSTFARERADALIKCIDASIDRVTLAEIPHQHRRYLVFYAANFSAHGKSGELANERTAAVEGPVAGTTTNETPASGIATVAWDVVLVRDAPKTGAVVGRVLRGSKVKAVAHQGEWYRIQFGSIEGWVYRGTIGL